MTKTLIAQKLTALVAALIAGMLAMAALLALFSYLLTNVFYADNMIFPFALTAVSIGGLVCGFLYSGRFKKNTLLFSLLGTTAFAFVMLTLGLCTFGNVFTSAQENLTLLGAMFVGSIIGGILRANKKR